MYRIITAGAAAVALALPAGATVLYSTDFASPAFSPGPLNGQNGWMVESLGEWDINAVVVENTVTDGAGQAVELPSPGADDDVAYYAFGPIAPTGPITVSMAIRLGSVIGSPAYFEVGSSPSYDDMTAGVELTTFFGDVSAITTGQSNSLSALLLATGVVNTETWIDVSMTLDYASQTYSVSVDGTLLGANIPFCGGRTTVSDECLGNRISQFDDVGFTINTPHIAGPNYITDVSISEAPEPSTWVLAIAGFGLAGAGLRTRRRPRYSYAAQRHSFATAEFSDEKVRAIAESRMNPRHAHLDALLDEE